MSRRSNRASISDGEFILDCKAAYVDVIGDIRKDITNKSQLLQALQDTGRNPTERVLKKYWHADTDGISFDDFVDICRKEQVTSQEDMMKAFRRIDINGDGFLSLDELFKIMNSKGETMSKQEVKELLDSVDENGDGKLDYKERKFYYEKFCNLNLEISKQLRQKNRKRLERAEKGERRSKKVESFSDSKRASTSRMMGSTSSLRSESNKTMEQDKRNGDDEDAEEIEEEEEEVVTSSRRRSSAGSKADLSSSYKSRLKGSGDHIHGSHASLRSDKRHGDDEDAEEVEEEEEEVVTSSRRRSSAGSKADLSSSYKSRLKGSGDHIHGSHASLRSAGMSGSRRSLLSVGDLKDSHSTPVPAQRKTLSRSLLAEDDMPRPSPRSNKKGAKHVPASKLGNLTEEPKNKRDWTKCSSKGCFFIDEDNGLETHNFRLTLAERSKVWITIQPVVPQSMIIGDTTPIDTMLLITRKRPDNEGRSVLGFTEKRDGKGKYGVMCDLKAGTYNLLPFTTGCHLKPRRSDSSKETPLVRKDREGKTTITKAFKKALEEIFDLSDLDGNGTLSRDEFTWFTVRTSGDKVTDDEWNVVEETVELDKNDEITKEGFVRLNEMEAEDVDDDVNDLWVTLNSMGYNKDLFIDEACPYKVDIYTENCDDAEMALTCTGIEAINHDMIMETVTEQDEGVKIKGSVYMYTYANDTRSTVVLYNRSSNHVNVTMDCASSKNCQINRDKDEYSVTLGPHEKQIAHHLMPMDETLDWTPRCVESVTK
ncbi:EF-hand calcium-binding domain-containing protein 7-like isoform X16 [Argopecten irradians]|uniref:EF-hand calcium-binding domain-containing protein 7-like isoform X16 n=1 Tax=Argopecten irradians TaxID=31199 RepID=UPI003723D48D